MARALGNSEVPKRHGLSIHIKKGWPRIRLVSSLPKVSGKRTDGLYVYKLHCSHDMASIRKQCLSNVSIVGMWFDGATSLWSYRKTEQRLPAPTTVKFTLEYATKTYRESKGIALLFL